MTKFNKKLKEIKDKQTKTNNKTIVYEVDDDNLDCDKSNHTHKTPLNVNFSQNLINNSDFNRSSEVINDPNRLPEVVNDPNRKK